MVNKILSIAIVLIFFWQIYQLLPLFYRYVALYPISPHAIDSFLVGVSAVIILVSLGNIIAIINAISERNTPQQTLPVITTRRLRHSQFFLNTTPQQISSYSLDENNELTEINQLTCQWLAEVDRLEQESLNTNQIATFRQQNNIGINSADLRHSLSENSELENIHWLEFASQDIRNNSFNLFQPQEKEDRVGYENLANFSARHIDLSELLNDLIGQRDRVSQERFHRGEKIYLCLRCQSGYHEDSWEFLGGTCEQCHSWDRVREFILPI